MTTEVLRTRLKHIAGLLLGVACDVGIQEDTTEQLTSRVLELEQELEALKSFKIVNPEFNAKLKKSEYAKEYYKRKKLAALLKSKKNNNIEIKK